MFKKQKKEEEEVAGDVAQLLECLPNMLEFWVQSPARIKSSMVAHTCNLTIGGRDQRIRCSKSFLATQRV